MRRKLHFVVCVLKGRKTTSRAVDDASLGGGGGVPRSAFNSTATTFAAVPSTTPS